METINRKRVIIKAGSEEKGEVLADIFKKIFSIAEKSDAFEVKTLGSTATVCVECDEKRYGELKNLIEAIEEFVFPSSIVVRPIKNSYLDSSFFK